MFHPIHLSNAIEQRPSRQANNCSAGPEILYILQILKLIQKTLHIKWKCLLYMEYFYCVDRVHGPVLHGGWCAACCEVYMIYVHESACLIADNIWNEGK
jgi:hypothetical protein